MDSITRNNYEMEAEENKQQLLDLLEKNFLNSKFDGSKTPEFSVIKPYKAQIVRIDFSKSKKVGAYPTIRIKFTYLDEDGKLCDIYQYIAFLQSNAVFSMGVEKLLALGLSINSTQDIINLIKKNEIMLLINKSFIINAGKSNGMPTIYGLKRLYDVETNNENIVNNSNDESQEIVDVEF